MADGAWRNSYLNHLVKLSKGEEPSYFEMASRQTRGAGHMGEWLTEYALALTIIGQYLTCQSTGGIKK